MVDYAALLEEAKNKIATLTVNTHFSLKDLFDGVHWEEIPRGARSFLGRCFKNAVLSGEIEHVIIIGENKIHSTLYQKH